MTTYVFIDSRIHNVAALMSGLAAGTQVITLDATQDGVAQIAQALQGASAVDAIHVISHGADGTLYLGNGMLNGDNLAHYTSELAAIGASLTESGDILLYGCDVAATAKGQRFIEQLARLTGADVAASSDATGAAALGGNWQLESRVGPIESPILAASLYAGLLDVITGDNNANNLAGTANNDQITGLGGNDSIDGAGGVDTAIYSGPMAGYSFSLSAGKIVVTDTNLANGNEGADQLTNVEAAQFSDGSVGIRTPGDFRVNTYIAGPLQATSGQTEPAITKLSNGDFVVTWTSWAQDGDKFHGGAYAQRYDASGAPLGTEFRVDPRFGSYPTAITALADGGFVVAWTFENFFPGNHLQFQKFDASGVPQGLPVTVNDPAGSTPSITTLANGDFVLAWLSAFAVLMQRFDAAGVAQTSPTQVNTIFPGAYVASPTIAALGSGWVVTWSVTDSDGQGIHARVFDAAGVGQPEFQVPDSAANDQLNPAVAALSNGGFVVTWQESIQDGSGYGIYAHRYNAQGAAQGSEFRVNTHTANDQYMPAIAALSNGGFAVAWESNLQDGNFRGIYAQRYDSNGAPQGAEFLVAATAVDPAMTYVRGAPAIAALDDGGFVVTWSGAYPEGHNPTAIFAQRYDASGNPVPATAGANLPATLTGDANSNLIDWSGLQAVNVESGDGADTLSGSSGNDTLNGGAGSDTANYDGYARKYPLDVGLTGTTILYGPDGVDRLISIEKIQFLDGSRSFDTGSHIWQIDRLYGAAFDRQPDALGLNYHTARLDGGTALTAVAQDFANSAEFISTYGNLSNTQFVNQLYLNVLHRPADAGGRAYWSGQLNSGAMTRGDVLVGFSESVENVNSFGPQLAGLWDIDESVASVARLYMGTFDRAPDPSGLTYWTNLLKTGAQTLVQEAEYFVVSPEFQQTYGPLTNSEFVNQLYLNVLSRPVDAGGLSYWTSLLDAGTARAEVVVGFTESYENQVRTIGVIDNGILVL